MSDGVSYRNFCLSLITKICFKKLVCYLPVYPVMLVDCYAKSDPASKEDSKIENFNELLLTRS